MSNKNSSIKKEIFLPSIIGDWTTYTAEKNKASISITKSIGSSNKTISENTIETLLFFHQELFESFFDRVIESIDSHIVIDTVSINVVNHSMFKEAQKSDMFISKLKHDELEQIDFLLSKKATKFIAHRLCGGNNVPESNEPTDVEISIMSIISRLFFKELSQHWKNIFETSNEQIESNFGNYFFTPQQHESETIIEISTNFKLFNHHDLTCKAIYSLETIEKLLYYQDQLNEKIVERTSLNKETLNRTMVDVKSILGSTTLTLQEIQNLELGDVVLIEDKKISDPIRLVVDDEIKFNAMPVSLNDKEIGVQILNTPVFDKYISKLNRPDEGPLLSSKAPQEQVVTQPSAQEPTNIETTPAETFNEIEEPSDEITMESPQEEMPMQEEPELAVPQTDTSESIVEAPTLSADDDDDFSWDDLE